MVTHDPCPPGPPTQNPFSSSLCPRQRYQQMRRRLVKFRALVHTYTSHRRYLKVL